MELYSGEHSDEFIREAQLQSQKYGNKSLQHIISNDKMCKEMEVWRLDAPTGRFKHTVRNLLPLTA